MMFGAGHVTAGLGPASARLGAACRGKAPLLLSGHGPAGPDSARHGVTVRGSARQGSFGQGWARQVGASQVSAPLGVASLCSRLGRVWLGLSGHGRARQGLSWARLGFPGLGEAPPGATGLVVSRLGPAPSGLARHHWACQVKAWCGSTGLGLASLIRSGLGTARQAMAGRGTARKGSSRLVLAPIYFSGLVPAWRDRRGGAGLGETGFGMVRHGQACPGTARPGAASLFGSRQGSVRRDVAGLGRSWQSSARQVSPSTVRPLAAVCGPAALPAGPPFASAVAA